ncbi:MAG TPA: FtsX-like permease family protein [Mycobacteriales bacterium]|nr:FtsX-like permease family protein [Mycobacteriales bacterium]
MTASVEDRPITIAVGNGGRPARNAVIRWAWRLYRREWRRQALVLALLITAIAATVLGLGVVQNAGALKADPTFGTANTLLTLPGSDDELATDLAALQARFGSVEAIAHQSAPVPGSVAALDIRSQDPHGPYGHVTLRLDAGNYPGTVGEAALTAAAMKTFGVHVGGDWTVNGHRLRVVGVVENPLNLLDQFALVAPGQANPADHVSILLDARQHAFDKFRLPSHTGLDIAGRGSGNQADAAAIVLVLSSIGLLFVGLMAVAGFAVLAHRRQRALGTLASLGATDRHLRLVLLANGAAVGATAAVGGAILGLAVWFAVAPAVQSATEHRVDGWLLPWWAVAAAMLLTLVTATGAAWWPARAVARLSPVAALSGRPPRPKPAHRFAAAGMVLLAAGIVLLAFADQHRAVFIIGGTLITTVGVLLLAPLAIRQLAAIGRQSPIAVTMALRDLSRYQARSGAALGAITLAVGVAATIAVSASAADRPSGPGNLAPNQLVMYVSRGGPGDPVPLLSPAKLTTAQAGVDQVAATLHAASLALDQAYNPQATPASLVPSGAGQIAVTPGSVAGQASGYLTPVLAKVTRMSHGEDISAMTTLYVATPAVLAHYGFAPGQINPDADLITARADLSGLQIFNPMPGPQSKPTSTGIAHPVIQVTHRLPGYTDGPGILLTGHAMQTLGLQPLPASWLLETTRPLTSAQVELARTAAAGTGLYVKTRQPQRSLAPLRNWTTGAGILLALGVLGMTVGLIRSETASDLRILTAAGASRTVRRTLTAATAGALALLGAFIGTAGAYAALLAWNRSNLTPLDRVPWLNLVAILVGLPLIATGAGYLGAGREPAGVARQPLE